MTKPFIEHHYSFMSFLLAFDTSHEAMIFVFGVANAKSLAFGTPDAKALRIEVLLILQFNIKILKNE